MYAYLMKSNYKTNCFLQKKKFLYKWIDLQQNID